ncbi:MAG: CpsB/CapC family capsule biosynthesis tyrosine phosphatase [Thermodesulfobacteriota bacterium]
MIDLHCHILPGIDDGAADLAESIRMAELAAADGIHAIVATPHNGNGVHVQVAATIRERVSDLQNVLEELGIPLRVHAGAEEHFRPELVEDARNGRVIPIDPAGRVLLLEFPFMSLPDGVEERIFRLQTMGYRIVLAHPERNVVFQHEIDRLLGLVGAGCLTQITEMSLTGDMGEPAFDCALEMIERRMAHILASDAHSADFRYPRLSEGVKIVGKITKREEVGRRMVLDWPQALLAGEPIECPEPLRPKRKRFFFF